MTGPLSLALTLAVAAPQQVDQTAAQAAFDSLSAQFIGFHQYFNPIKATLSGIPGYDSRLPDVSRTGLRARAEAYQTWLDRIHGVDRQALAGDAVQDWILMEHAIRAELLDLLEVRGWERDPTRYVDLVARATEPLVDGVGPPARRRMNSLTSRLRQVATVLAEARTNLRRPPAISTELAIEGADQLANYLERSVLTAFDTLEAGPGKEDFQQAAANAAQQMRAFRSYLRDDLLPRSTGEIALGRQRVEWTLQYREHVDRDLDELLVELDGAVDTERRRLETQARSLDRSRSTRDVLTRVNRLPLDEDAEAFARERMDEVRSFVLRNLVFTVPSDRRPIPRMGQPPTPWDVPGVRAPGPFHPNDDPALLRLFPQSSVGDPGPEASGLTALVLEASFPGAFVESMAARRAPTRLRKLVRPATLTRGWGRYASDFVVGAGFREGDEALRLVLIHHRLRDLAEARAAIHIHANGATLEAAAAQLGQDAFLDPDQTLVSARRAALRPLETGVLGALEIGALADDFASAEEGRDGGTTPRRFHDAFLATGLPPALARSVLLPDQ